MLPEKTLINLYIEKKKSVAQIALLSNCSPSKINYWLSKHNIKKRSISDAMYQLKNPLGDPFSIVRPQTLEEGILFGLGIGLYWGEGAKRGAGGLRITNTDSKLVRKFIEFLVKFFNIDKRKLRFGIQIFSDISPHDALSYWQRELGINKEQFYKTIVIKVRGSGTYKYKSKYGGIILYFNNTKLKKTICEMIENIQ